MPVLSIIVPVYNVEAYLPQCLDSLRCQTFRDIEIICIDDGSPDRSGTIAELYAQADERIRVFHKSNGGLSSARNAGIWEATGEYLCFVDSDDLVKPGFCETLIRAFRNTGADVVTFGAVCYPAFCRDSRVEGMMDTRDVVYDGFSTDILFKEQSHPFACRTAVKRSFLVDNSIFFDEDVPFGEDQIFHFAIYPRASKVAFISDKPYLYRFGREGSLTTGRDDSYANKLKEHCGLVTRIASDWQALGLMERYGSELLFWSVEFLVPPLDALAPERRSQVCQAIAASWEAWFGDRQTVLGSLPEKARSLALLVYEGADDNKRFLHAVKRFNIAAIEKRPTSFKGRIKNALRRLLPASLPKPAWKTGDHVAHAQWYADDAARTARSIEAVRLEITKKQASADRIDIGSF